MISKHFGKILGTLSGVIVLFWACEPIDKAGVYEEKLVVFGNLVANNTLTDTIYISRSYSIAEPHEGEGKWIPDADVTLFDGKTTIQLKSVEDRPGRYVDPQGRYRVVPNTTYDLNIQWQDHYLTASTTVPDTLRLRSVPSTDWECNGEAVYVDTINLYEKENTPFKIRLAFTTNNFSILSMDTVVYKEGSCYTTSFASVPMFVIKWEAESEPGFMRLISYALKDDHENAIVDTTLSAHIFKGHMLVDSLGLYYWTNPLVWNLSQKMLDFGWLSFNYYGPHMIEIQVVDKASQEYYRGFPMGMPQNQYILPASNVEGGYGLFSSTYSKVFFIYVKPEE